MRYDILTIFPKFFNSFLATSLIAKAVKKGIIKIHIHDIRQSGIGKHKSVDDRPYGGGPGMVLRVDVLAHSLENLIASIRKRGDLKKGNPYIILLDPAGEMFNQEKAQTLAKKQWLILICGHYEGVDERFKDLFVDEVISIGDYILNGGETAAQVLIEASARLIKGFMGKEDSKIAESFSQTTLDGKKISLLDYPTYTRPESFQGQKVPPILLSGDREKIKQWRLTKAIEKTKKRRPDLLQK